MNAIYLCIQNREMYYNIYIYIYIYISMYFNLFFIIELIPLLKFKDIHYLAKFCFAYIQL